MNSTRTILKRLSRVAIDASIATQFDIEVSGKSATIVKYKGKASVVDIPSTFKGVPVTNIGRWAFSDCTSLTSITIGNSVISIGSGAFSYCTHLTSVNIPNSVTRIGRYAFSYCTRLTNVMIGNSVTSIGSGAFSKTTKVIRAHELAAA